MNERTRWISQIDAVADEYETAVRAVEILGEHLRADPSALRIADLRWRDFQRLCRNLEGTYLIRMFAEFETGLRSAWTRALRRKTHPRMADLMNSNTGRCRIPMDWHAQADQVRTYRNWLVHERAEIQAAVEIHTAGRYLRRYFSLLPAHW